MYDNSATMYDNERYELLQGNTDNRLFFNKDGKKRIDFVLAYKNDDVLKKVYFDRYLQELEDTFHLDYEKADCVRKTSNFGNRTLKKADPKDVTDVHYIKIHAPIEVLYQAAEDMKMKMATKKNDINIKSWYEDNAVWDCLKTMDPFLLRNPVTQEAPNYFVATFDEDRLEEFFNYENEEEFFTPAERGRLVNYILKQVRYGDKSTDIGINNLIHKGVFLDDYPLHDGPLLKSKRDEPINDRQRLQKDWVSPTCFFKYQPLDTIREYFGDKLALYFAWLGFYTTFLIPAALVGILCFIYGVVSAETSPVVLESCSDPKGANGTHVFYMCPLCDKRCSYFLLNGNCMYSKATHHFDNEATFFFAIFMSMWATLFLEFWKRYEIELAYKWHTTGFKNAAEPDRPEYLASNLTLKRNRVNGLMEKHMPRHMRIRRMMGTVSVVLFFVLLVFVCIVGVMVFRAALSVVLIASDEKILREKSKIIVSIAAGLLNLVAINILKFIYNKVATRLTDWENPRTRTQYEDSFTIKVFLFQFFNTYSSCIYVAFLKRDAITGTPGRYRRFGKDQFRLDGCSYQGCFLELTIQLIIIMVGQQFINNIFETLLPTFWKWRNDRKEKQKVEIQGIEYVDPPQWAEDYRCEMQTKFTLFWQYCEIVLQYGFVTMFVAGFPLAPFFALLNNILEIRVDAYNFVHNRRRPVAEMAEDIGAWYGILATITSVSVLINAFVLAFTSELIPSLVYKHTVSRNGSMVGFVEWSMSSFNVRDFTNHSKPLDPTAGGIPEQAQCRYPGYREPYAPYNRNILYYEIAAVRFAFVLCFVIFIGFFSWTLRVLVPDIPNTLELKMKRENFLASRADKQHKEKTGKRNVRMWPQPSSVTADGGEDCERQTDDEGEEAGTSISIWT